jgi:hypothetical protein
MGAISRICLPLLTASVLVGIAAPAHAQVPATRPYKALFLIHGAEAVSSQQPELSAAITAAADTPTATPAPASRPSRKGAVLLPALYGGFVTLQALDAHSTFRALDNGHSEQNPVMRWTTSHPVAFVVMKSAATAGTVYFAEKIRKKHPKGAVAFITAVNAAYAVVVLHNYRAGK